MNHYVKVKTKEREFLVFKVIGAESQEHAEKIIRTSMGESFQPEETTEGFPFISPLSHDLRAADRP